jgi:two-component system, chemotaxis family, sensor kinase CheA
MNDTNFKLFDTLLEPTFIINAAKKVVYCNEPAALISDLSIRKIMRAESFEVIFKFDETISALSHISSIMDSSPYQEVRFETETGKSGKVQITLQPFPSDSEPLWIVYFRDVTLEETLQKKYRAELEAKEDYINELKKAQAELKNYSENLEKMVEARTAEIARMNQLMGALLDSLNQGFFIFDQSGKCLPVSSRACLKVLETDPKNQQIEDVFKLKESEKNGFQKWLMTVFSEMLPFEDLAPLGPQKFIHSENLEIKLEYFPLRNQESAIEGVVVVASDITDLIKAQQDAEIERAHASMILQFVKNKKQILSFINEAKSIIRNMQSEIAKSSASQPPNGDEIFLYLHTLKGGSASFSIKNMADHCHTCESILSKWKFSQSNEDLDLLLKKIADIPFLFENFLKENSEFLPQDKNNNEYQIEVTLNQLNHFYESLKNKNLPDLAFDFKENFILEPVSSHFKHFNDVIQSVAEIENKKINSHELINGEIKIWPQAYESLFNSLVHAYRNAVDHGIESPETRLAANKEEFGSIKTQFSVQLNNHGEFLQIEIIDDGNGIPADRIREKLLSKGIDTSNETDEQVIQHIFDPQFSTKEHVTETSGRGVGMDAIKRETDELGGTCTVKTELKKGTRLLIQVPYIKNNQSREIIIKAA